MDVVKHDFLDTRLANLVQKIDLQALCRIPHVRMIDSVVTNVGLVELVSAKAFEDHYQELYVSMFHSNERERPDLIVSRLDDDFAGRRGGLAPYRVVGVRDRNGEAIGAAQFSDLVMADCPYAVPYLQYIYVRPEHRRQNISELLHTMVLAVASADAQATGEGRSVPFTLFETDPPNHGSSESSRTFATQRTMIHSRGGARAMMLASKGMSSSGATEVISAHVQPGLEPEDDPLTLVWATRPSPLLDDVTQFDINELGRNLIAAYYRSMRDEGFPEANIALAERIVDARCEGRTFIEMPLSEVTAAMYQNIDRVS